MEHQHLGIISELSRHQLEQLAVRAMAEAGKARREVAAVSQFSLAMIWFSAGALTAAAGFIMGQLLR